MNILTQAEMESLDKVGYPLGQSSRVDRIVAERDPQTLILRGIWAELRRIADRLEGGEGKTETLNSVDNLAASLQHILKKYGIANTPKKENPA